MSASRCAAVAEPHRVFEGAPDLVVEILSPSDRPGDVHAKVADYLAAGTRIVWVIDAGRRSVAVYRDLLAPSDLGKNDSLNGEDVLPGFEVRVETIFEE